MDIYTTEEQQIEAIKNWWASNGVSVIVGIILGAAAIFGWKYSQDSQAQAKDQASGLFEQMHAMADKDQTPPEFWDTAKTLENEFAGTGYSYLGLLLMANQAVKEGKLEQAVPYLQTVLNDAMSQELKDVARARLARIYIELANSAEALKLVQGQTNADYLSIFAEIEGDAHRLNGDFALAKDAYQRAFDIEGEQNRLLKMKLDDVAASQSSDS